MFYTGRPFSTHVARTYFVQLIDAIDSCHKKGIVHRDIKLQNFFLDRHYCLKLGDFGLCRVFKNQGMGLGDRDLMTTFWAGTKGYQCPEMLEDKAYGRGCDIFSCGVALFIMLTGYPPFEDATKSDHWYKALARAGEPGSKGGPNHRRFWRKHASAPLSLTGDQDCQDLVTATLAYNPKYRASCRSIMNHPYTKCRPMLVGRELMDQVGPHQRKALEKKALEKRRGL